MERGAPVPEWVENAPTQFPGDDFYLRAFWDLSTQRQIGFTVGPIPALDVRQYACEMGLPSHMMELFEAVIRGLDRAYLKHAEKTRKTAQKKRDVSTRHIGDQRTRQAKTTEP